MAFQPLGSHTRVGRRAELLLTDAAAKHLHVCGRLSESCLLDRSLSWAALCREFPLGNLDDSLTECLVACTHHSSRVVAWLLGRHFARLVEGTSDIAFFNLGQHSDWCLGMTWFGQWLLC